MFTSSRFHFFAVLYWTVMVMLVPVPAFADQTGSQDDALSNGTSLFAAGVKSDSNQAPEGFEAI